MAAFYGDCKCDVQPVMSGSQVALVYDLVYKCCRRHPPLPLPRSPAIGCRRHPPPFLGVGDEQGDKEKNGEGLASGATPD